MKILVYGAGNIGCLYAARLKDAGHDVAVLARGKRLQDIRTNGIQLEDFYTKQQTTTQITTVERLAPNDEYDLVLVVMPWLSILEVLPILAANENTHSVIFFANNAGGSDELVEALGPERVLLGFPGEAGVPHGNFIRCMVLDAREQPTTIGEVDGVRSPRIEAIANAIESAGFPVSICDNMDAWLKTHVAEISPTASALYMAGGDRDRLTRTPDAMVLMIRAIREGFRVLSALGIPLTPANRKMIPWIPEPLLLVLMRRKLEDDAMTIKIGHASNAHDEMKTIADQFTELARRSGVETPALDSLRRYLEDKEPIADGSAQIRVNWVLVWAGLGLVTVVMASLAWWLFS